jgi:hypothetical protein
LFAFEGDAVTDNPWTTPPTSEEVHAWIDSAYRRPEGAESISNDGVRFTRWNMEVAFMAGWKAAMGETP